MPSTQLTLPPGKPAAWPKMHGTKIWVVKDGKIVGLDP